MAQHGVPEELPAIVIEGNPDLRIGFSGGGGWGLNSGPRRGEGGTGRFNGPGIPGFKTVIIEEHVALSAVVDAEYAPRNAALEQTIQAQINEVKTQAGKNATTEQQQARQEYLGLEQFIKGKQDEYNAQTKLAYSFWGTSPLYKPSFFLAHSAQEAVKRGKFDNFFADYMSAYGAAHESRIIDRTLNAALAQLGAAANRIDSTDNLAALDYPAKTTALAEKAQRIRSEQQAHFHALPEALQAEVVKGSSHIQGMSSVNALTHYQIVLQNLIDNQHASLAPYPSINPKITAPLTTTEVEALTSLVEGQSKGIIGPRWKEYHLALLRQEYIRHMQNTRTAFSALQVRAEHLEQQLAQAHALETARLLAEQQAQEAARRLEAQHKTRITYASVASASTLPFMAPMGNGAFPLAPEAYRGLQSAIRLAIPVLRIAALASGPLLLATIAVGAIVILWPKDEPRQTALSIPLADLSPPDDLDLTGASVELPYVPVTVDSDEQTTLLIAATATASQVARVPVVAAHYDPQQKVYSVALENPQRILTWTPAQAPGGDSPPATPLPEHRPETSVYEGASLTPVQPQVESYPALDLIDQERIIVTFPVDSGLAPIVVMFRDRRMDPGVATGRGQIVAGVWLGDATRGRGAPVPEQIAAQLSGKEFKNFKDFREAFWKAVAGDSELANQFDKRNVSLMRNGKAPKVRSDDRYLSLNTFALHHHQPISEGGEVYDLDNIRIVTPLAHNQIHYGKKP